MEQLGRALKIQTRKFSEKVSFSCWKHKWWHVVLCFIQTCWDRLKAFWHPSSFWSLLRDQPLELGWNAPSVCLHQQPEDLSSLQGNGRTNQYLSGRRFWQSALSYRNQLNFENFSKKLVLSFLLLAYQRLWNSKI